MWKLSNYYSEIFAFGIFSISLFFYGWMIKMVCLPFYPFLQLNLWSDQHHQISHWGCFNVGAYFQGLTRTDSEKNRIWKRQREVFSVRFHLRQAGEKASSTKTWSWVPSGITEVPPLASFIYWVVLERLWPSDFLSNLPSNQLVHESTSSHRPKNTLDQALYRYKIWL